MNTDQITGIIRAVVPALLAFAVGKGWISNEQVGDITAAIVTLASVAWSLHSNRSGKTIQ